MQGDLCVALGICMSIYEVQMSVSFHRVTDLQGWPQGAAVEGSLAHCSFSQKCTGKSGSFHVS